MTFSSRVFLAAVLLLCSPVHAADSPALETFALKNGMRVILIENHRVPAVTHMLWYRVGAADDFPGKTGLAHYNEHMMFQGTEKYNSGDFLHAVSRRGGRANAFTSRDYTAYFVSIAKEHLPLIMEMEADRMLHLAPTQEHFDKERQVIIEERRMTVDNKPEAVLAEEMNALLLRNHPYREPVIGWMHEMEGLTREDVLAFHRQFYAPVNATLVVSGDMTLPELKTLVGKYYEGLPPGAPNIRHWAVEPPQRGARRITLAHPNVKQPSITRYYAAPSVNTGDHPLVMPAYLLSQTLGGGATSQLYQSLVVKQKIATSVEADFNGLAQGPGNFEVSATPAEGVSLEKLEEAIDRELAAAMSAPPEKDALARAKTLLKADTIYARDGNESMARTLGTLVMADLPVSFFADWPKLVDEVRAGDVQKAANAIFNPDASVTGYLLPKPAKGKQ